MFYLHKVVKVNVQYLRTFSEILSRMDDSCFLDTTNTNSFSGAIGAHCRHVIEFYDQFLFSFSEFQIDYDSRKRNLNLEQSKQLTEAALLKLIQELDVLVLDEDQVIRTTINNQLYLSSIGRELSYLSEHTVHHFAIIRFIAELKGFSFNDYPDFGIAQSTSIYRLSQGK